MAIRLAEKFTKTLQYLLDFKSEKKYWPSIREIAEHFEITRNAALERVYELEKKITSKFCVTGMVGSVDSMFCGSHK